MIKQLFALVVSLSLLPCLTVRAREVPQVGRTDCSVTLRVEYHGAPLSGGSFTAIRVGEIREENGNFSFRRCFDGATFEDISSAQTAEESEEFVLSSGHPFAQWKAPLKDGQVSFQNLPTGLYLIRQETPPEGYLPVNAFLVSLPCFEHDFYRYHLTANTKTQLEPMPKPTKPPIWEPDDRLPQTGQPNWIITLLSGTGVLCLVLGWYLTKKKMP